MERHYPFRLSLHMVSRAELPTTSHRQSRQSLLDKVVDACIRRGGEWILEMPLRPGCAWGDGKLAGVPAGTWRWTQRWSSLQRPRPLACGIVERTQSPPLASPPFQPQLPSTGMMGRRASPCAMVICRSRPSRRHLCQTLHKGGAALLFSARVDGGWRELSTLPRGAGREGRVERGW